MQIITGKTGTEHVKPEHDRSKHAGTYGTDNYVLNVGSKFAATVEPSTNTIRIADGDGMMQGTHFRIPHGDYDNLYLDNGTTGYIRKDLIVARYTKSGEFEDISLAVIKGEPSASTPQIPECTTGNILEGATLAEMPLYEVTIDCTVAEQVTITVSEPLFDVSTGLDDVYRKNEVDAIKNNLQAGVNNAQSTADTGVSNAAAAQSTANTARQEAATAQSTANTARQEAEAAHQAADGANNNASIAQGMANDAIGLCTDMRGDINTLFSEIDSIKKMIEQLQ